MSARTRTAWLGIALALCPTVAPAHPHVFIDGGVDLLFDAEGRLDALRVTWIYDPLTTLFMLEDLEIDPAEALTGDDRTRLAAYQTEWFPEFEGDSYLWDGDRRVGLSGPRAPEAEVRDGLAIIRFVREVETPFRPGADTVVKVYDPTYFTAYAVTETPRLEGTASGCDARVVPFEPDAPLAALQQRLLDLDAEETPEDPDVGALFADKVFVTCD